MAGVAKLINGHILDKSNNEVDLNRKKYKGKIIGLYFSAHWCAPCRAFTPKLTELYNEHHNEKNFEVIFISSDSDKASFKTYYNNMPWLVLDYNEQKIKEKLLKKFNVTGIPKLVLLDGDSGRIICSNAKDQILNSTTEGINFPWKLIE